MSEFPQSVRHLCRRLAAHPRVAINLNNLALLLQATNRLAEAEPLYRRELAIDELAIDEQSFGDQGC